MRKIFTLLCAVALAVQFAAAQKTLYVLSPEGKLSAFFRASKVSFDDDLLSFTYGEVTEISKESFSASFSVAFKSDEYKKFSDTPEVGVCFSDLNECPTISEGRIKNASSLGECEFSLGGLDAGTTYYYRAYVKVNDVVFYGDVRSETTYGKKPDCKVIDGHKFVDLGLPSGLLWAKTNVGAWAAADAGNYYAWGETEPHSSNHYYWDSYKYGTSESELTKYNATDQKTVLDKEDDAAYVNWGTSCRMPTSDEFTELLNSDNCTWIWTSMTCNDVSSSVGGYKVISKKNGNSIFLPASGIRLDNLIGYGSWGDYWSATLSPYGNPWALGWGSDTRPEVHNPSRYGGNTVRPVAEP